MPPTRPSKRPAAEDFVREFDAQRRGGDSTHKKPRFDARNPSTLAQAEEDDDDADQDAILELDEIGKGGLQAKRNAVRLEGYESDSSNEGFDARADEKERAKKAAQKAADKAKRKQDADDGDMFAELEDDFDEDEGDDDNDDDLEGKGKKRKEMRVLEEKDIQGQVASSRAGSRVKVDLRDPSGRRDTAQDDASDDSESDVDDEERDRLAGVDEELGAGAKKANAPKLDAFNMKNEATEGKFDETGNFVRNAADAFAVHDSWMEGTSKKDIRRAREAHEKRERERRERDMADDAVSTSDILATLIKRLDVGETVLEALARYGAQGKKQKAEPKWKQKRKNQKSGMDVDGPEQESVDAGAQRRREAVESITAAADQLMSRGQEEVYEAERELLMRQYKRETGEDWVDTARPAQGEGEGVASSAAPKQWEYQWADARDGGEVHGPYDGATMSSWNAAGYFGEGVQFRLAGSEAWRDTVPDFTE